MEKDFDILQNAKGTFTNSQNELIELRIRVNHLVQMEADNKKMSEELVELRNTLKVK